MPTVPIQRDLLYKALGKQFTEKEFDDFSFAFGVELDEITTLSQVQNRSESKEEPTIPGAAAAATTADEKEDPIVFKFDVAANRYDLLCLEGLSLAMGVYLNYPKQKVPNFVTTKAVHTMVVKKQTERIRPFVVCAVLRGVTFDKTSYQSFLDLQGKLHDNICRGRKLVAIGTHDLSTIEGPFTYEALPPKDISFVPLVPKTGKTYTARELLDFYRDDKATAAAKEGKTLKPYTDIIYDSPVYPVIFDSKRRVLSLPPIINGDHSKMKQATKDIFIECTAVDETKGNIVLNMMVTMFSKYCARPFEVEQVNVVYEATNTTKVTPDLSNTAMTADVSYINTLAGTPGLPADKICENLGKMMLTAKPSSDEDKNRPQVISSVPPLRPDILHACDIAEDAAIGFGYNNIKTSLPPTNTVGKQQPINYFTELLRSEMGLAGFQELLTLGLNSTADNFTNLRKKVDDSAVILQDPVTVDFQLCRTTLLPGLLNTLAFNIGRHRISEGLRAFEISDVVHKDPTKTDKSGTGTFNRRHFVAAYVGRQAGFEVIHGLVDHFMSVVGIAPTKKYAASDPTRASISLAACEMEAEYWLEKGEDTTYLPGYCPTSS